jgi:hypothetical protein
LKTSRGASRGTAPAKEFEDLRELSVYRNLVWLKNLFHDFKDGVCKLFAAHGSPFDGCEHIATKIYRKPSRKTSRRSKPSTQARKPSSSGKPPSSRAATLVRVERRRALSCILLAYKNCTRPRTVPRRAVCRPVGTASTFCSLQLCSFNFSCCFAANQSRKRHAKIHLTPDASRVQLPPSGTGPHARRLP